MKMTIDLPEELVRQVKLTAIERGCKVKEVAADALRKGLRSSNDETQLASDDFTEGRVKALEKFIEWRKENPLTPEQKKAWYNYSKELRDDRDSFWGRSD